MHKSTWQIGLNPFASKTLFWEKQAYLIKKLAPTNKEFRAKTENYENQKL